MSRKKKETLVEKAEELAEKVVHNAKKIEKEIIQDTKKIVGKIEDTLKLSKKEKPAINESNEKKIKLAKLLEKAKALESELIEKADVDLKSKIEEKEEDKGNLLVSLEDYMKSSIHLGTRVITPDIRPFVYRRRSDGLAIFNTSRIDEKIRGVADFVSQYKPSQILLVCKREAGWFAVKKFAELTGVKIFTKKYPAGILTNSKLSNFMETDLIIIVDPWLDKNALNDASRIKIPVVAICDTNNYTQNVSKILLGNNKSYKSIGLILFLLAKLYREKTKADYPEPQIQEFIPGWDNLQAV